MSDDQPQRDAKGRFPPGVSGNIKGRPKGRITLSHALQLELDESQRAADEGVKRSKRGPTARELAKRLLEMADAGDRLGLDAFREFADRTEGKATQAVELRADINVQADADAVVARLTRELSGGEEDGDDED